ncbi:MAG: DUF6298 domain-containing protein [Armatimonadota bacterium]
MKRLLLICIVTILATGSSWAITTKLSAYSGNPRYFYGDGRPVVLIGAGQPRPSKMNENYRGYIDEMAAHKVNYGRVWHLRVWDSKNNYFPWARSGGGTANDGLPKFDLTKWDSNFWARMKDACSYAASKGVYLDIMLFDECGIEAEHYSTAYKYHPFHPSNNVNSVGLPSGDAVPEFYSLGNSKLKYLQELYVAKMVSELSGYPNVIFEVCNELTGPWDWEKYWVDYVSARCSNLIAVNRLGSLPSAYWTDSKIDSVNFHWGTYSTSTTNSNMRSYYGKNKAVNYDEPPEESYVTYTNYRNVLWASFVGGGHIHLENGYNSGASYDATMHINNFINGNGVRFWEMSPANSLVTSTPGGSAYTLAKPGSEYVTYITGSGSGSMKISLDSGYTYSAKAYNPSTGAYTTLSVSGGTVSGIPSYSSDIVIYVKAVGQPSTTTPNVTLSLAVDKSQAHPGDTLTYALTYKNAGSGEAKNVVIETPISDSTTYLSAGSGGVYDSGSHTLRWTVASIVSGATGTLNFQVKVK